MTITSDTTAATTTAPARTTSVRYSMPGLPWLAVDLAGTTDSSVSGTLDIGTVTVPVQASTPSSGVVRIDAVPASLTFAALAAAAAAAGGTDPLAALPPSLAAFVSGIAVSHLGVTVDASAHGITAAEITVATDEPWSVLPGHFDVADAHVTVRYTRAGDSCTVEVTGGGTVLGSAVELTVLRGDDGVFTVALHGADGTDVAVPGLAELAGLVGAPDLVDTLPAGLSGLPGFVLSGTELVLGADGVKSARLTVAGRLVLAVARPDRPVRRRTGSDRRGPASVRPGGPLGAGVGRGRRHLLGRRHLGDARAQGWTVDPDRRTATGFLAHRCRRREDLRREPAAASAGAGAVRVHCHRGTRHR